MGNVSTKYVLTEKDSYRKDNKSNTRVGHMYYSGVRYKRMACPNDGFLFWATDDDIAFYKQKIVYEMDRGVLTPHIECKDELEIQYQKSNQKLTNGIFF